MTDIENLGEDSQGTKEDLEYFLAKIQHLLQRENPRYRLILETLEEVKKIASALEIAIVTGKQSSEFEDEDSLMEVINVHKAFSNILPGQTARELPTIIDETVQELLPKFTGMEEYLKKSEDSFAAFCHSQLSGGIGMKIRNEYGFWDPEKQETPLNKALEDAGCTDADSKSDYLLRKVYQSWNS